MEAAFIDKVVHKDWEFCLIYFYRASSNSHFSPTFSQFSAVLTIQQCSGSAKAPQTVKKTIYFR